jgi:signal transduction histidine kinase
MTAYSVAGFHVISGVCVLAAVRHMLNGLWRPFDKSNILFSVMCCFAAGTAWTQAQLYQTWSIDEYAVTLKWNISFAIGFLTVLPWFTSAVTGRQSLRWLIATTLVFIALLALNLIQPSGAQLARIERIETKYMPWGEAFASPVGPLAPSFWFAITAALLVVGDSAIRFLAAWRREKSGTSMLMVLSTMAYFAAGVEAALVRAQVLDFIHLGPFGFFLMVIAMSFTLSFRSRQNLLVSERRFRALMEQSPFGIQVLAADGGTVQVNPAWERLWGKNASDERLLPLIERAFLGHKGETHPSPNESGQWIRSFVYPIKDPNDIVRNVIVMHEDVTEEKRAEDERERLWRLEAQIAHTNRLSMLGELTASIAHEINQPIGASIASAGAGLRWLDREQPALQEARDAFRRIKDDGKRAADIITGLKAFYKKDVSPERVSIDVNEVVREMLVLLRGEADRYSVTMRTELAPDLPAARANRVQLQQVLMNLMVNGIEAMKDKGGELVIRTEAGASGLKVSVSDTGVGIPAEQMDQIFNAFVTTKSSGTGLGLAISRTIIESHDGELWIEARPGTGARFCFTLPDS